MKRVEVGLIVKAHGLKGEVVVGGVRLSLEEFRALGVVHARAKDGSERALTLKKVRPFLHQLLVIFEEVRGRDEALQMHGQVLEVEPERLPENPKGEVYLFELVGLDVRTETGTSLGRVRDVLVTGAAPVLVVRDDPAGGEGAGRERLLPMSPDVLLEVDTKEKFAIVRLLPGMEDL
ncbi:MAG: ribosome maturation factor RimM [Candidatus Eiseniibacteriota bacterium]